MANQQINQIYKYVCALAETHNHKSRIVNPKTVAKIMQENSIYIVTPNEIHFMKLSLQNDIYFVFHKDNNFNFSNEIVKHVALFDIQRRIKLFLQDSLDLEMNEKHKCSLCINECEHFLTCHICNIYICKECRFKSILNGLFNCPKCRYDLSKTEKIGFVITRKPSQ